MLVPNTVSVTVNFHGVIRRRLFQRVRAMNMLSNAKKGGCND